jgi:hypothetical protein
MPVAKKNAAKKALRKRASPSTVVVVRSRISAKDNLFPEKVARARKILSNTQDL